MALPPTRPSGPFRPTRLGPWEVIAKIAGGGMSAVYLGRRSESAPDLPNANVVALKIARHEVRMDEQMLGMFLEEGKLIARLVHPNIVRTLEVGGDAELDFIAMELMLGKTFAAIHDAITLREVRLNPQIVAWTAARIADALHYAHELADESGRPLGLVHRDVNPANVFATFTGDVKLFDFGLAKLTAGEVVGTHLLAGKLSYLSPEQIMQMPLDRRSDIFSLGTTFWELLTGRRLFRRDTDVDTVRAVQLGPIPDPRSVAPEIPEELARIAKTALERNREHRYPNAAYLARELDAFVYQRSSATEVAARLAQLVDTLFPGEQKRQSGWLKPAISNSRQMSAVTPSSVTPSSATRPAPPASSTPREVTEVMANAPVRGVRHPGSSMFDAGLRDSIPGPVTPRDGVSSYDTAAVMEDDGGPVPPMTERGGFERPFSGTPADDVDAQPISSTMTAIAAPTGPSPFGPASPPPPPAAPPASIAPAPRSMPAGPLSTRPWPSPTGRPAPNAPPLPQRARPSVKPPPVPPTRPSDEDISKTEIQLVPPTVASPQSSPRGPADSRPSVKPPLPRPRRAPIPLPSRASVTPNAPPTTRKAPATDPPSSDTQVDRPGPRNRKP